MRKLILLLLLLTSFFLLLAYLNQEPPPDEQPILFVVKKKPSPTAQIVQPEQPPVSANITKAQKVSKDIKKEKVPVSKEIKKEPSTPEEVKKEQAAPEEIKKEQPPVSEEGKKEKPPVAEKSLKEISKLKEKCEKQCKKIFQKQYNDGTIENSSGLLLYKYKSHYNKKNNKCFMLITEDGVLERYKKLLDVNENNSYGSVRINDERENLGCYLLEKKCKSEEEWDSIVKHYMEE